LPAELPRETEICSRKNQPVPIAVAGWTNWVKDVCETLEFVPGRFKVIPYGTAETQLHVL
jgi:hypothetical protein